jgi:hypothetical protein
MLIKINDTLFLTGHKNDLLIETRNGDKTRRNYSYEIRILKERVAINTKIQATFVIKDKLNKDGYLVESVDYITPEELTKSETEKILLKISEEYKNY